MNRREILKTAGLTLLSPSILFNEVDILTNIPKYIVDVDIRNHKNFSYTFYDIETQNYQLDQIFDTSYFTDDVKSIDEFNSDIRNLINTYMNSSEISSNKFINICYFRDINDHIIYAGLISYNDNNNIDYNNYLIKYRDYN